MIQASVLDSTNFTMTQSEVLSWRVEACEAQTPALPQPPPLPSPVLSSSSIETSEGVIGEPEPSTPPVLSSSQSLSWNQCQVNGTAAFGFEIQVFYLSDSDTADGSPFTHLPDLSLYPPALSLTVPAIDFETGSGIPWTLFPADGGNGDDHNGKSVSKVVTLAKSQYFAARFEGYIHIAEAGIYKVLIIRDPMNQIGRLTCLVMSCLG